MIWLVLAKSGFVLQRQIDVLNIDANVESLTGKYKQQNFVFFPLSLSSNPLTVDHNPE